MLTVHVSDTPIEALRTTARVEQLKRELLDAPHTETDALAHIARRAYEAHADAPAVLRRAYAFADQLRQMPLYVRKDELLAGNRTPALCAQNKVPREWWAARNDPRTGASVMQYEAAEVYPEFLRHISPETLAAQEELLSGYPAGSAGGFGHIIAGYDALLDMGAKAIAERARQAWEDTPSEDTEARDSRLAMAIAWEAFSEWGGRYAEIVARQAEVEACPRRRAELMQMRETLSRVPAERPETFREALQAVTLMQFALLLEQPNGGSISMGGIDRVLYPYLREDLKAGRLTWAEAEELVDSFYVKLMENAVWPREVVMFANLSIGGRDSDGADAVNDLSLIFLESTARIRSTHPMLSVRWHPDIDRAFFDRVCELLRMGMGLPALFSDPIYEAVLEDWGMSHEEAARYGIVGCVEPAVMGLVHGQTLGGHVNLLMCLELAMNDGRTLLTDRQLGPRTGRFEDFHNIEDLWTAYTQQVEYACRLNAEAVNAVDAAQRACYGYPFMSGSMAGAIEAGRDLSRGVKVNMPTVCMVGVSNVADAMLAIEEVIYERRRFSPDMLMAALRQNYDGYEVLRRAMLNVKEKFGNGSERAVACFNRLSAIQQTALDRWAGPRGGRLTSGLWATTWHVRMGEKTGASADGRHAKEPLVDGIGAVTGRAHNGPTAVALDVAGIDARRLWQGGYTFNLKFNKALLNGPDGVRRLSAFIHAFFMENGMQMQINTIDKATLIEAQRDPEHHADLIVRVAGFSAYFCALDKGVQDEIISRSEHAI